MEHADLFVGVTPDESVNMNACMIAHALGAKKTVARIDNYEYLSPNLKPFFEQMNARVIAFVGGLLAAMLIAYASFGGGMIAKFVDTLRSEYDRMPDAALQPLLTALAAAEGWAASGRKVRVSAPR